MTITLTFKLPKKHSDKWERDLKITLLSCGFDIKFNKTTGIATTTSSFRGRDDLNMAKAKLKKAGCTKVIRRKNMPPTVTFTLPKKRHIFWGFGIAFSLRLIGLTPEFEGETGSIALRTSPEGAVLTDFAGLEKVLEGAGCTNIKYTE